MRKPLIAIALSAALMASGGTAAEAAQVSSGRVIKTGISASCPSSAIIKTSRTQVIKSGGRVIKSSGRVIKSRGTLTRKAKVTKTKAKVIKRSTSAKTVVAKKSA